MSIIEIRSTITPQYLRNRTKDECIDHVLRLCDENDKLTAELTSLREEVQRLKDELGFANRRRSMAEDLLFRIEHHHVHTIEIPGAIKAYKERLANVVKEQHEVKK